MTKSRDWPPWVRLLAHHIRKYGPILAVRASSAAARGKTTKYSYWGVARYEVRLNQQGRPTYTAMERASSDRRSARLAERDARALADKENRLLLQLRPGPIDPTVAMSLLRSMGGPPDATGTVTTAYMEAAEKAWARSERRAAESSTPDLDLDQRLMVRQLRRYGNPALQSDWPRLVAERRIFRRDRYLLRIPGEVCAYVPTGNLGVDAVEFRTAMAGHRAAVLRALGPAVLPPPEVKLVQLSPAGSLFEISYYNGRGTYVTRRFGYSDIDHLVNAIQSDTNIEEAIERRRVVQAAREAQTDLDIETRIEGSAAGLLREGRIVLDLTSGERRIDRPDMQFEYERTAEDAPGTTEVNE